MVDWSCTFGLDAFSVNLNFKFISLLAELVFMVSPLGASHSWSVEEKNGGAVATVLRILCIYVVQASRWCRRKYPVFTLLFLILVCFCSLVVNLAKCAKSWGSARYILWWKREKFWIWRSNCMKKANYWMPQILQSIDFNWNLMSSKTIWKKVTAICYMLISTVIDQEWPITVCLAAYKVRTSCLQNAVVGLHWFSFKVVMWLLLILLWIIYKH